MCFRLALLAVCSAALAQTQATLPNEEEWKQLHREAVEIRGLEFLHPVPIVTMPYSLHRARASQIARLMTPQGRDVAYKKLGLYPSSLDEVKTIEELQLVSWPALYSYQTHEVVYLGRGPHKERNLRLMAIEMLLSLLGSREELHVGCHELVHALQAQHFEGVWASAEGKDSDHGLALRSLFEGDANLAQYEYVARLGRRTAEDLFAPQGDLPFDSSAWYGFPALDAAPRVLREGYMFSYTCGTGFARAVRQRGGWEAVNHVYADPPQSTEQILHPEKYLDQRDDPVEIVLPDLTQLLPGWQRVYEDGLGEHNLRVLMRTLHPDFSELVHGAACAGWGGDRFVVLQQEREAEPILVWAIAWDSEADALEFFEQYRWTLCARYNQDGAWGDLEEGRLFVGLTEWQGVVVMKRTGKDLLIVEGLPAENEPLVDSIDAGVRKESPGRK